MSGIDSQQSGNAGDVQTSSRGDTGIPAESPAAAQTEQRNVVLRYCDTVGFLIHRGLYRRVVLQVMPTVGEKLGSRPHVESFNPFVNKRN